MLKFSKSTPKPTISNYSCLWGNNCVICHSTVIFFVIFCTIKCHHLTNQKISSLRKLKSMGIQLHRCDNLQLVQNCLCRIFWLTFFVCFIWGKKVAISVHAWEKIMYATREEHDDFHSCFCALASLVRNFTLLRIIIILVQSSKAKQVLFMVYISMCTLSTVN